MRNQAALSLAPLLLCFALGFAAGPSSALTIEGIEFTDWLTLDVGPGANVDVSTTANLYVYAPDGLMTDQFTLAAVDAVVIVPGIAFATNVPTVCAIGCTVESLVETRDVVLRVFGPLGQLDLSAQNIVVSTAPIPEPGAGVLLAFGIAGLARNARARHTPPTRLW